MPWSQEDDVIFLRLASLEHCVGDRDSIEKHGEHIVM